MVTIWSVTFLNSNSARSMLSVLVTTALLDLYAQYRLNAERGKKAIIRVYGSVPMNKLNATPIPVPRAAVEKEGLQIYLHFVFTSCCSLRASFSSDIPKVIV